ncbi:hypothetical protein A8D95_22990 [Burkholderia cenocepacia]|uniref:Uncharacterized protein n=1 Tax=Burkholderia cenocepacia TaxID=95486 RepID=A0A1V2VQG5_9BURK|nr:hypothetical protein A8D61_25805 [Burkholderia cenocepacia]EPZ87861.1 hypothetical protein BURCENK562V_C4523 [Burkholderia cenocepacia K56-2Valvano]AQQ39505.1 hypothetical protein A8E75_11050 [Burkholderia cenocepacia]ONJ03417.1 hypothetical protein A8D83_35850 [Burkholderia cenocepacia]ONJ15996.1 hypothetical protein A8D82_21160 [Burkholderia cenocepacia]
MHAHGWHGRPARRRAPRVPGAAAAAKRPGPGTAWRTGVMSNGRVVRDRGTAILAIGRSKCILMERLGWTGAGFAGIAVISLNDLAFYLNDANNPDGFPRIGPRARCRSTGGPTVLPAVPRAVPGRHAWRSR